jgi:hypothetical protein
VISLFVYIQFFICVVSCNFLLAKHSPSLCFVFTVFSYFSGVSVFSLVQNLNEN